MKFNIIPTKIFLEQVKTFDEKTKRIIESKIELIKINPYRFKKIHSKQHAKVFRIRLNIDSAESRLIYTIIEPNIILVCVLLRKNDYNDLEQMLEKIER